MTIKSATAAFATLIAAIIITTSLAQAAGYTITDLGTLGGTRSLVYAINESGQITGESKIADDMDDHAFIYENGSMRDIHTLGGINSKGAGINDNGEIVGSMYFPDLSESHIFVFDGGTMHDLGALGSASDINNSGHIVGTSDHAFIYDGNTSIDLGTLGGNTSSGIAINNAGQVTGSSRWDSYYIGTHLYLYDNPSEGMQDLGTLSGNISDDAYASDINESGQICGYAGNYYDSSKRAFFYDGNQMHDLGTLGGFEARAYGINNHGHVVGSSYVSSGPRTAFWYDGNQMLDLCVLTECLDKGWEDLIAEDINDNGEIIGNGEINDETHGFLIAWTDEPIPEMCADSIDNDHDGATDCQDSQDCGQEPRCYVPAGLKYGLTDLGTLGGDYSIGNSINNHGQIAGSTRAEDNSMHAFLYDSDGMQDLGFISSSDRLSKGYGINDHGHVTGFSGTSSFWGEFNVNAYIHNGTTMTDLQPLLNHFCSVGSKAYAINDSGQVTGYCISYYDDTWGHSSGGGFFYDGASMHDLTILDIVEGTAINNLGQITGYRQGRAFIYDGNTIQNLGDVTSHGYDINDSGHVTGKADFSVGGRAFLFDGNDMHELGHLGGGQSKGRGINENDQVVGDSSLITGYTAAFLHDNNRMLSLCAVTDCKAKGWTRLTSAADINTHGDITGYGEINGETHAFLAIAHTETVAITSIIYLLLQ